MADYMAGHWQAAVAGSCTGPLAVVIAIKLNSILVETILVNVTISLAGNNGHCDHLTFRHNAGDKRVAVQTF
jgi:hypothetical protein